MRLINEATGVAVETSDAVGAILEGKGFKAAGKKATSAKKEAVNTSAESSETTEAKPTARRAAGTRSKRE